MIGGKYSKTLAKIHVRATFHMREIQRSILPKFMEWRSHVRAHPDEYQHGTQKITKTSVTEFCFENVTSSLEELKISKATCSKSNHKSRRILRKQRKEIS